jgi:hypothetical protein
MHQVRTSDLANYQLRIKGYQNISEVYREGAPVWHYILDQCGIKRNAKPRKIVLEEPLPTFLRKYDSQTVLRNLREKERSKDPTIIRPRVRGLFFPEQIPEASVPITDTFAISEIRNKEKQEKVESNPIEKRINAKMSRGGNCMTTVNFYTRELYDEGYRLSRNPMEVLGTDNLHPILKFIPQHEESGQEEIESGSLKRQASMQVATSANEASRGNHVEHRETDDEERQCVQETRLDLQETHGLHCHEVYLPRHHDLDQDYVTSALLTKQYNWKVHNDLQIEEHMRHADLRSLDRAKLQRDLECSQHLQPAKDRSVQRRQSTL